MKKYKPKVIAIVPARKGSKRIKNKNMKIIKGKYLIEYTIDKCVKSKIFDKIYINSDSDQINNLAKKFKIDFFKRPPFLAKDKVFLIEVIKDMIINLNLHNDFIAILLPTSPLRTVKDIKKAFNLFKNVKKGVVSVAKYETPIQLAQFINKKKLLYNVFPKSYKFSTRSTDHENTYRFNGSIIINNGKNLIKQKNLIGKYSYPYIMPRSRSIDIDHQYQFDIIKKIIK